MLSLACLPRRREESGVLFPTVVACWFWRLETVGGIWDFVLAILSLEPQRIPNLEVNYEIPVK